VKGQEGQGEERKGADPKYSGLESPLGVRPPVSLSVRLSVCLSRRQSVGLLQISTDGRPACDICLPPAAAAGSVML